MLGFDLKIRESFIDPTFSFTALQTLSLSLKVARYFATVGKQCNIIQFVLSILYKCIQCSRSTPASTSPVCTSSLVFRLFCMERQLNLIFFPTM